MKTNEKLKKEIKKMSPSERERLKKEMEESLKEMKTHTIEEQLRLPSNPSQEVYLTFWDKFLIFIFSILGIMSNQEYIKRKRLRIIKDKVAKVNPPIMNVNRKILYAQFGKYLYEIYIVFNSIYELLEMTVFNSNVWDNVYLDNFRTCSEYLFEFLTNTRSLFGITDLKSVISEYKSLKKIFDRIEVEVNNNISTLDPTVITRANKIYTKLVVFKNLIEEINFKRMLKYFSDERGKIDEDAIPDFWFIQEIEKLCNIISEIDITPMMVDVINSLKKYIEEIIDKTSYDYKKFNSISQILVSDRLNKVYDVIEKMNFSEVVSILKDDPDYIPIFIVPEQSLVNVYKDVVINKSKNFASKTIKAIIKEKSNVFFYLVGKNEDDVKHSIETIYTEDNNERLITYRLNYFVYPTAFTVAYSFIYYSWKPILRPAINDVVVNGLFKEKYLKNTLSSLIQSIDEIEKDIMNFIKQTTRGGEYYATISKFFDDPNTIKVEGNRRLLQQKISVVNSLAGNVVLKLYDALSQLNKYLKFVLDDYSSLSPEYILNIKTVKGIYNKALIEALIKGKEVIESVMDILVHYTNQ